MGNFNIEVSDILFSLVCEYCIFFEKGGDNRNKKKERNDL